MVDYKFGRAHAFFHAVRPGKGFITVEVIQSLLSKNAMVSRYFIQRLLLNFGSYDERLIRIRAEYNPNSPDMTKLHTLISPWVGDY